MPSIFLTSFSMAASRASVSRLPRPASTKRRVLSVSSKVMLPELPEASMETRKPIADSCEKNLNPKPQPRSKKQIFSIMAERRHHVNRCPSQVVKIPQAKLHMVRVCQNEPRLSSSAFCLLVARRGGPSASSALALYLPLLPFGILAPPAMEK